MPEKTDRLAGLSTEEFDRILHNLLRGRTAESLLSIPGVYEAVVEEFNNEVIETWEAEQ